MSNVRGKPFHQIALAAVALGLAIALSIALSVWQPVKAQDGAPEPEQEVDFCLVSLSAEREILRVGEPLRIWVWGVGVEPGSWKLAVNGAGVVSLRSGTAVDASAELIEWTVTGESIGEVTFLVNMTCLEPGNGADSLTLTVLPAEPEAIPEPQSAANFCTTHLSLSDQQVQVGDSFYAWFVGAGTGPRSWNLTMSGDGSARVVGTRELDPEYVEWELEAVSPGVLRLTGEMNCLQAGEGASSGEVVITEAAGRFGAAQIKRIWTSRTVATIEAALLVVLVTVLAVLVYLLIRRRR